MRWYFTRHSADLAWLRMLPGTQGFLVASRLWRSTRVRRRCQSARILASLAHDADGRPPAGVRRRATP